MDYLRFFGPCPSLGSSHCYTDYLLGSNCLFAGAIQQCVEQTLTALQKIKWFIKIELYKLRVKLSQKKEDSNSPNCSIPILLHVAILHGHEATYVYQVCILKTAYNAPLM
jgi:hypothetical protein